MGNGATEETRVKVLEESQVLDLMNWIVDQAVAGVHVAGQEILASAESLAASYRTSQTETDVDSAIDGLIRWETGKSFTVGFVAGLGGVLSLPIAIPADMAASWIIQARLVAAIALLRGYRLDDERVRTMILASLVADAVKEVLAEVGIKVGEKVAMRLVQEVPRAALIAVNKAVGFRLLTKFGEKGLIQLSKLVPVAGGLVGGGFDAGACYATGHAAKSLFSADHEPPVGAAT